MNIDKVIEFAKKARESEVVVYPKPEPEESAADLPSGPAEDTCGGTPDPAGDDEEGAPPNVVPIRIRPLTDTGNAERLVTMFRDWMRWTSSHGWLVWRKTHWVEDDQKKLLAMTKKAARSIYGEAARAATPEVAEATAKHAARSESARGREAMLTLATSEDGIAVRAADLNRDPWLFNVRNGTINLKTGILQPHRREDLITRVSTVPYVADAEAPVFTAFLERILPDPDVRTFVKRFFGYALTGTIREHVLGVFWGTGRNGKTTLLEAIAFVMGEYFVTAHPGLLLVRRHEPHPTERATLFGRRIAVCMETGAGERLNEPLVKALTGGDTISARKMRQDEWNFQPTHKLVLVTNSRPRITGSDEGIWRRIRLVPFDVTIPEEEQDATLPEKLRAEAPGILRWLVEGCMEWQRDGLKAPAAVVTATNIYREEQDSIAEFLTTTTEPKRGARTGATVLYKAYVRWAEDNGETPVGQKRFGESMTSRGHQRRKGMAGWFYADLTLRDEQRGAMGHDG